MLMQGKKDFLGLFFLNNKKKINIGKNLLSF